MFAITFRVFVSFDKAGLKLKNTVNTKQHTDTYTHSWRIHSRKHFKRLLMPFLFLVCM